eukprot:TRINITY_DN15894_c0_g1_i1.p1 TRINITY_DN15894_c0_g1~~TRINITY_DN15894_c0_g1_i1.p1  ORF type:complete len:261 (+),score=31.64 TRINITY_DN15894_c0_g1_i1:11-793(+)
MSKLRVFIDNLASLGGTRHIVVSGNEQRHIRANRLREGDIVELFDRAGTFLPGTITSMTPFTTQITMNETLKTSSCSRAYPLNITLAIALPKATRADLLMEKVTEIGVSHIIPITTKRTIEPITDNKLSRWNRLILAASKQSLCPQVPTLEPAITFAEIIPKLPQYDLSVWGCMPPSETDEVHYNPKSIMQLTRSYEADPETEKPKKLLVFIGPEGDFTAPEKAALCESGAVPLVISGNRLRTETAAMIMIANLMSALGE